MAKDFLKAEEISVFTFDEKPYVVSACSENIQRLMQIYNVWRQEQVNLRLDLTKLDAALKSLSNDIVLALRQETEEAENPSQDEDDPEPA